MNKLKFLSILAAFLLTLTACGGGDAPAPSQAPTDAPEISAAPTVAPAPTEEPFSAEAFLQEVSPIVDVLYSCDQELFGAKMVPNEEYFAGYAYGENGEEVLWLYPSHMPLPEGCWEDPAMASYYPVKNFATNAEVRAYLEQFMSPDVVSEKFHDDFLEYDGSLYLIRGGRGYGTLLCMPESLRYVGEENGNRIASIDYEMFEAVDHTATLVFSPEGEGWRLTDIRE